MTVSVELLSVLILGAIVVAAVSPIVLLVLWLNDWMKDQLW